MSKFFCDTNSEIWYTKAEELGINVIKMPYTLGNEMYFYDLGKQTDCKAFFDAMRNGESAKTQALNMDEYIEYFEPVFASGEDIIYVTFSQSMSGTFNSMHLAIDSLKEKYPERKILYVDTLQASMGQGLMIWYAWNMQKEGKSIEEICAWNEEKKLNFTAWLTVNDLMHLKRGGRVSAATAIVGSMLNIKPVLHVDNEGHLINVDKARGRKASLKALLEKARATAIEPEKQTMFISHGGCAEEAEYLAEMLKKELNVPEVIISYVGPVIGSHSGPGTMALFFFGTER